MSNHTKNDMCINAFVRLPKVIEYIGVGKSTLYKLISEGKFPPPIKIAGGRSSGWRVSDIHRWLESQS